MKIRNFIHISIFCFLMNQSITFAESLSVDALIIKSQKENDTSLLSLAYKRCAGFNLFLNVKFAQSNFPDAASGKQKNADLFSIMAAQQDLVDEESRGIKNSFKSITERQKHLIEGSIYRIALFYAEKSNDNYVKNGSIISGDPLLESDFEMCKTMLMESIKIFK